jgi:hypothetical protein
VTVEARTPPAQHGEAAVSGRAAAGTGVLLIALILAIISGTAAARYSMAGSREFDPDEFQHMHAAWNVSQGLVPYRDFFEHHMPALPLALASWLDTLDVDRSADDVVTALRGARYGMWVASLGVVLVTWAAGLTWAGARAGGVGAALLSSSIVFTGKGLEIRPDGPATVLWVGALWLMLASLEATRYRRWLFCGSGALLGAALVFSPKILLAGPGLAVASIHYWAFGQGSRPAARVTDTACQLLGMTAVIAALTAWFAARGAAGAFLHATLLNNLQWPVEVSATSTLAWLFRRDPLLLMLGCAGAGVVGSAGPYSGRVLLASVLASLALGLFLIPAPYPQYLLLVLPILALFAGTLLADASNGHMPSFVAVTAAGLAFAIWSDAFIRHWIVYPAFVGICLAAAFVLIRRRSAELALAVLLMLAIPYQAQQLRWMAGLSNDAEIARLRFVHAATTPTSRVLDGFSGYAWFRPAAFRYHFLHPGVRALLTDIDRRALVALITSPRNRPALVLYDTHLKAVSPTLSAAIEREFEPAAMAPVWVPRQMERP